MKSPRACNCCRALSSSDATPPMVPSDRRIEGFHGLDRAYDVGFDVDAARRRHLPADGGLDVVYDVRQFTDRQVTVELELGCHEELLRPEVLGADVDHAADLAVTFHCLDDASLDLRVGGLTDEEASHLDRQDHGDDHQEHTDGKAAERVVTRV